MANEISRTQIYRRGERYRKWLLSVLVTLITIAKMSIQLKCNWKNLVYLKTYTDNKNSTIDFPIGVVYNKIIRLR